MHRICAILHSIPTWEWDGRSGDIDEEKNDHCPGYCQYYDHVDDQFPW